MKKERIVFMGTPAFAANVLNGLIKAEYQIVGVVTQADKKTGRKQLLTPSPVKEVALEHQLPIFQPLRIRNDYEAILKLEPDLIITCAYGQIIPKALLDYPPHKCINTHGSLLPKYRGGAPIQRAIMNGEKKTGITIMYMNEKMDEGDILYQKSLMIEDDDTSSSLFAKLSDLAKDMLIAFLPDFFQGNFQAVPQDHSLATYAYNLTKEDEFVSFKDDVNKVYDHLRGLLDHPGGYGIIDGLRIKLSDISLNDKYHGQAGEFLGLYEQGIVIACQNGSLICKTVQVEGKKAMPAAAFYNGLGKGLVHHFFE